MRDKWKKGEEEGRMKKNKKNDTLFGGNKNPPETKKSTFKFPIKDRGEKMDEEIKMKNIPPFVIPKFYGMASEDPDSFLFEFDIVCRTYGLVKLTSSDQEGQTYLVNGHRLKIYHKPVSKEDFMRIISHQKEVQIVQQSVVISKP